jgi:hypothetical protein
MLAFLKTVFSSSIVGSIERVAMEAIETDKESAEAKALWVKTLDPNGIMRRELSRFSCQAYGFYLLITSLLLLTHAFGIGDPTQSKEAAELMTQLFLPITTAWGGIVGASFGVNATNSIKGR